MNNTPLSVTSIILMPFDISSTRTMGGAMIDPFRCHSGNADVRRIVAARERANDGTSYSVCTVDRIIFESGRAVREGEVLVELDARQERAPVAKIDLE